MTQYVSLKYAQRYTYSLYILWYHGRYTHFTVGDGHILRLQNGTKITSGHPARIIKFNKRNVELYSQNSHCIIEGVYIVVNVDAWNDSFNDILVSLIMAVRYTLVISPTCYPDAIHHIPSSQLFTVIDKWLKMKSAYRRVCNHSKLINIGISTTSIK